MILFELKKAKQVIVLTKNIFLKKLQTMDVAKEVGEYKGNFELFS